MKCFDPPIAPWSVTRTRTLVADRWITVRADDCLTSDGHAVAPYYVIEFPDWVQIIAIDDEDHLLLVEQYRHGLGIVSLELPSGVIDAEDADPIAAGQRELVEETGYAAREWRPIASLAADPARQTNHIRIVLALGAHQVRPPDDDPAERLRLRRVPVDAIAGLILSGEIAHSAHVAALALGLSSIGRWRP